MIKLSHAIRDSSINGMLRIPIDAGDFDYRAQPDTEMKRSGIEVGMAKEATQPDTEMKRSGIEVGMAKEAMGHGSYFTIIFTSKFSACFRSIADVAVLYVQKLAVPTLRTGRKCRRLLRASNFAL